MPQFYLLALQYPFHKKVQERGLTGFSSSHLPGQKETIGSGTCSTASERCREPGVYAAQGRGQRRNRLFKKDRFEGEASDA